MPTTHFGNDGTDHFAWHQGAGRVMNKDDVNVGWQSEQRPGNRCLSRCAAGDHDDLSGAWLPSKECAHLVYFGFRGSNDHEINSARSRKGMHRMDKHGSATNETQSLGDPGAQTLTAAGSRHQGGSAPQNSHV